MSALRRLHESPVTEGEIDHLGHMNVHRMERTANTGGHERLPSPIDDEEASDARSDDTRWSG